MAGCGTLDQRLTAASSEIGRQAAGVSLPALPPRCREPMPRVTPRAGEKWRAVQGRWQIVADGVDRRTADCAAFYDDVRAGLSTPSPSTPPSR
ncbi:hypothetical protein [Pleomorphomonas sp. NRK KF1]|uniref:hypothetical protein n=1 Tax=Pleomorphomonas sp. NRK KF1 TaxID=2943000 RepID=UPI002043AC97|nr:hypothetical protein [Pleomorphomonas sp. NRK KF1]MCM5554008.1 hypothetical protein [Pleomorphomonas sp. NRK KF1]